MSDTITSRPYAPKMACERCCFGTGDHADWCPKRWQFVEDNSMSTTNESIRKAAAEQCLGIVRKHLPLPSKKTIKEGFDSPEWKARKAIVDDITKLFDL